MYAMYTVKTDNQSIGIRPFMMFSLLFPNLLPAYERRGSRTSDGSHLKA